MTSEKDVTAAVEHILARTLPSLRIIRIEATDLIDTSGDESLDVKIVVGERPSRELARKTADVVDQLRSWLAEQHDSRFPYLHLTTEREEAELAQLGE
jgi:hypothetical protein